MRVPELAESLCTERAVTKIVWTVVSPGPENDSDGNFAGHLLEESRSLGRVVKPVAFITW